MAGEEPMLLFVDIFGEKTPVQAARDCTVGELKQLLQFQTGIPAGDQRLTCPAGSSERTVISTIFTDGEELTLSLAGAGTSGAAAAAAASPAAAAAAAPQRTEALVHDGLPAPRVGPALSAGAAGPAGASMFTSMLGGLVGGLGGFGTADGPGGDPVAEALGLQFAAGGRRNPSAAIRRAAAAARAAAGRPIQQDEVDGGPGKRQRMDSDLGGSLAVAVGSMLDARRGLESGGIHVPFDQAIATARRLPRPLACLLYNATQLASGELLRGLHLNESARMFLDSRFVPWFCDVSATGDEQRLDGFLRIVENNHELQQQMAATLTVGQDGDCVPEFPLFCVLVPQGANMTVGAMVQGCDVESMVRHLAHVDEVHGGRMQEQREARTAGSVAAQMQREQDDALQEALAVDRAAEASKRDEEERQQRLAQEAAVAEAAAAAEAASQQAAAEQEEARRRESVTQRRESRAAALRPEPSEGGVRVLFRLPSGERIQRRFHSDSTLAELFHFLDTDKVCQQHIADIDACSLVMSFPKRSYTLAQHAAVTLADEQITRDAAFFVQC
eukprot:TRINITY_DN26850_c0_g1_i1.p1 TRINITY_DN26850_c0_g1~~TRINITY_DN26850_c0_g1_i1.p1  ORF type:complete len:608 (+),score=185.31 TRINITY_DN26850_c0_g1_i1:152-1825(+)